MPDYPPDHIPSVVAELRMQADELLALASRSSDTTQADVLLMMVQCISNRADELERQAKEAGDGA